MSDQPRAVRTRPSTAPKTSSHATSGFVPLTSGRLHAGVGIGSWHGGHRLFFFAAMFLFQLSIAQSRGTDHPTQWPFSYGLARPPIFSKRRASTLHRLAVTSGQQEARVSFDRYLTNNQGNSGGRKLIMDPKITGSRSKAGCRNGFRRRSPHMTSSNRLHVLVRAAILAGLAGCQVHNAEQGVMLARRAQLSYGNADPRLRDQRSRADSGTVIATLQDLGYSLEKVDASLARSAPRSSPH